jgi:hypothetical protein
MLSLVQQQAEKLVANAREELDALERGSEDTLVFEEEEETPEEKAKKELVKNEVANMMQRLKVRVRKDAKSEDYELKPGNPIFKTPAIPKDDDIEMGGVNDEPPKRRTATVIREELSRDLRELADKSVKEMEAYDTHTLGVSNHYRQALERRTGKSVAPPPAPTGPRSILKNTSSTDSTPVSPMDSRRMSAGHIFAHAAAGQPVRTYESIGDVARRGSK